MYESIRLCTNMIERIYTQTIFSKIKIHVKERHFAPLTCLFTLNPSASGAAYTRRLRNNL